MGLDNVGDCEVCFVDSNKYDESYRDIQFMSLGKIIIAGESHFSRIAILYSKNWEICCTSRITLNELYSKYIRPNKYDIGKLSKDYLADRSLRKPKDKK